MKKTGIILTALFVMKATVALAGDINFNPATMATAVGQGYFKEISKELGSALAYRNLAPAAPLGVTGFDVALQASFSNIKDNSGHWKTATGNAPAYLGYPMLRVRKGFPLGIDIGVMYAYVSGSNIKLYGVEVSKALLEGGLASPALGVRATWTKLAGVNDLDLQTAGIDASFSKGVLMLTPYAGGGMVWINSKPAGNISFLKTESYWQPRVFAGVKFAPLPLIGITAEAEYAARPIYSLKLGVSF